jgi:hypothetical protein
MKTMDRENVAEWLDLDVDGQLGEAERARLAQVLAAGGELAAERRRLEALHADLAAARVAVRPGFRDAVMASLPAPAWRRGRSWTLPLAMAVGFAIAAALALAGASAEGAALGTGVAVLDLLATALLAGSGLLAASWRGLALALEELISASGLSLAAMALGVLFLNLLFFSMLRRRRPHDPQPVLERAAVERDTIERQ